MRSENHRLLKTILACSALAFGASAADAKQVLSAVESEYQGNGPADTQVSGTAGQLLSTTYGGADTRALTDYGVNKVYASGNAAYEQYATSAWLDTYTVGGTSGSNVTVSFTFSIDGNANFGGTSDASFAFNVYALRGGDWSMAGYGTSGSQWYSPVTTGTNYERLILTQTLAGRVTQADMRDFEGFSNYSNAYGQPGTFGSRVIYNAAGDYYSVTTFNPGTGQPIENRYYATGFQNYANGVPNSAFITYTSAPYALTTRNTLVANYSLLAMGSLCGGSECAAGVYPGTDLTLTFTMSAGSVFTLATFLNADDLTDGTIDFFNTAKVTGVTVASAAPGATLTSESGALQQRSDGSYGFAAVPAAVGEVPEPATWAMFITGFGLIGGTLRRKREATAVA